MSEELERRISELEAKIEGIESRNARVEQDKRWEMSWYRRFSLLALTYVCTSAVFWAIGVQGYFRNALIPTLGYLLSTLALPYLRGRWAKAQP